MTASCLIPHIVIFIYRFLCERSGVMTIPDIHPDDADRRNKRIHFTYTEEERTYLHNRCISARCVCFGAQRTLRRSRKRHGCRFFSVRSKKTRRALSTPLNCRRSFARLIERNAALNSLSDRVIPVCADIRNIDRSTTGGALDAVFANPPYMKKGAGLPSPRR